MKSLIFDKYKKAYNRQHSAKEVASKALANLMLWASFVLLSLQAIAQTNPVNIHVATAAPYALSLNDFGTGTNIMLNAVLRDLNTPALEVYFNIELESSRLKLKTIATFRPSTYTDLSPGVSVSLNNGDLSEYFSLQNLDIEGMNKSDFMAYGSVLPEGLYKFKVQAYSRNTGLAVSNTAQTLMGLFKGQAPLINTPANKGIISVNEFQNFNIQWTNRNSASYSANNNTGYKLEIWAMPDPAQDPNIIANSATPPILQHYTALSSYQYGPTDYALVPGTHYALRVQAIDADGRDLYQNNGYSQVISFTYGEACLTPTEVKAAASADQILFTWAGTAGQSGFKVKYQLANADPEEKTTYLNKFILKPVKPSSEYSFQVAAACDGGRTSEYSEAITARSQPSNNNNQAKCGDPLPKVDLKNTNTLPELKIDDSFKAYDFTIKVTRISNSANGVYAGEGTTRVKMLGNLNTVVTFKDVKLNTDYQMLEGRVDLQQEPYVLSDDRVKDFLNDANETKQRATGNDDATAEDINVQASIGAVNYNPTTKQIEVNDASGNTIKTLTAGKNYSIKDKDGNQYLVSADNTITKVPAKTASATPKGTAPLQNGGENTSMSFSDTQPIFTFVPTSDQSYAFDKKELKANAESHYEYILGPNKSYYYVPCKSVAAAGSDKVIAKLLSNPTAVDLSTIKFKDNEGKVYNATANTAKTEWTVNIVGALHGHEYSLFPYYTDANSTDVLCGKLNVYSFDRLVVNVKLIPLNGHKPTKYSSSELQTYLNGVYKQANIAVELTEEGSFTYASTKNLSVEHGKLTDYNTAQVDLITAYIAQKGEAANNTLYLFMCDQASSSTQQGFTPVNRSYGFIFGNAENRTFAHEIAHGYPLALEHPFLDLSHSSDYNNLLSYNTSTNLSYKQWLLAHNPPLKIRFGKPSDEGELQTGNYYYRPDGKVFSATFTGQDFIWVNEIQNGKYPNGAIYQFLVGDIQYKAVIENHKFFGYFPNGDKSKKRYEPKIDLIDLKDKEPSIKVIYTKSVGSCGWERVQTDYKLSKYSDYDWPYVGNGNELATAIPLINPVNISSGLFKGCTEFDEEAVPLPKTLGGDFYKDFSVLKDLSNEDKLLIKKIGNLINKLGPYIYESFYNKVKADENIENYNLLEAIILAYKLRVKDSKKPWKDIYESIKTFSEGVDGLKNNTFKSSSELESFVNSHFVNKASGFKYFFDQPFASLTGDRRNQLLSLYKGQKPNLIKGQDNISNPVGGKEIIASIIKYTSTQDAKKVLDHLYNENILAAVIESFDSYFYGGSQDLSEIISALTRILSSAYSITNFEKEQNISNCFDYIAQKKYLYFDNRYLGDFNTEGISESSSNLTFIIEPKNPFDDSKTYNVYCKPYDYLLVRFYSKTIVGKQTFEADRSYKLPALTAYLMFSLNTRQKMLKSAEITLDVASIAVGAGAVTTAIKTARAGLIIYESFELANDVVGITIDAYEDDVEAKYPNFYKGWKTYSNAYSLINASALIAGADKSAKILIGEQYFETKKIFKDPTVTSKTKAFALEYKTHLETEYADYIDEINQYLTPTKAKFDPSFREQMDDLLVDYIRNKLTTEQIAKLNDELKTKPSLLDQVNKEPKKLDDWVSGAGSDLATLFAGARQRAISKFGKEAEDLIYIKFNKDGGAAAEILDHYGTDGLNALKKFSAIDDAAKEIVKGKTVYRAVNETTFNFDKLKTQGLIDASPTQYPTYVSLDNITDANLIKSQLQLPRKPTWVAEFDGNQIISDVRVPNGKYLNADYKEVLCRSYPDLGVGGGSQFITNSPIKVKRLVNLETGDIIDFTIRSKVWDDILSTQPLYDINSLIYKSFEIKVGNNKIWIHGNATEHLRELELNILKDISKTPEAKRLSIELILSDFQGALIEATKNGVKYDEMISIGRWEFKFSAPRETGQLSALIHAQPK